MAVFLIFSDDWARHPSSCQHLTRCLMKNGKHRVFWVNTIGTRPPGFNLLTLRRGFEKIKSWFLPESVKRFSARPDSMTSAYSKSVEKGNRFRNSNVTPQPRILQPIMFPWFRSRFDRWLNRKFLTRQLNRALANETDVVAITTLPIVADLLGEQGKQGSLHAVTRWIYYCVDDWSRWPGMDAKPLADMEAKLIKNADRIIAAGECLRDRIHCSSGRKPVLLTHGVDLDFWGFDATSEELSKSSGSDPKVFSAKNFTPSQSPKEKQPRLFSRNLPRPIFVFWGLLDERLDPEILEQIARDIPVSTILMAGPAAAPEIVARLEKIPGLKLLGNLPYEKLPQLASEADVLFMPYCKNESTEQIQPLKMTEYLASGKPAVVRDLKAAQMWKDALDIADSPVSFSNLLRQRVGIGIPESQKSARCRLKNESWEQKAILFEKFILEDKFQDIPPY